MPSVATLIAQQSQSVDNVALQAQAYLNSLLDITNAKAKLLAAVEALKFKSAGKQFASDKFYAILTAIVNTVNTLAA